MRPHFRLNLVEMDDKKDMMDKLRYESRKQYLGKRKEDKKYELEAIVQDDDVMFAKEE